MSAPRSPSGPKPNPDPLHARFLALLPCVELHATTGFRHVRCPQRKADCIAEAVALAWQRFLRLTEQGKDVFEFPVAFACLVVRAVRCGRRLGGQNANEVLSPLAQRRHGFHVESLPQAICASHERLYASPLGQQWLDSFEERLHHSASPVPDQVAFGIDFPLWRGTRSERDRRVIDALMAGGSTKDVSQKFGLTPGRVSQLRRDFLEDWRRFIHEVEG